MMRRLVWILVLTPLFVAACDGPAAGPEADVHFRSGEMAALEAPPAPGVTASTSGGEYQALAPAEAGARQLIRRAALTLEVDRIDPAVERLQALALEMGGYVAGVQLVGGREERRHASVGLRVPAQRLDDAIAAARELGRVQRLNVSAHDVTDQLIDLEARLTNARRLEERLLRLLDTRTGDLQQVLAAERELARVRTEIEVAEGRRRTLTEQVALSAFDVTLEEPRPILGMGPGESVLLDAFRQAWRNFVWTIAAIIRFAGAILPIALLAAAIILAGIALRRRNRTRGS